MALLRQMLHAPGPDQLWGEALRAVDDPTCKCPTCRGVMRRVDHEIGGETVQVEVCKRCQMIWFDAHELGFFPAAPPPPQDPVPLEVRQKLAIADVQRQVDELHAEDPGLDSPRRWPTLLGLPAEIDGAPLSARHVATWSTAALITIISVLGFANPALVTTLQLQTMSDFVMHGLLTSFFVHAGWVHLLGNLWFLVVFGNDVEDLLGAARWFGMLVAATLVGSVLQLAAGVFAGDPRPCLGASGGITALVVYYALRLPDARLGIWLIPGLTTEWEGMGYPLWQLLSAKWWLAIWIAIQGALVYFQLNGVGSIAAASHLGGAAVGLLTWMATRDQ